MNTCRNEWDHFSLSEGLPLPYQRPRDPASAPAQRPLTPKSPGKKQLHNAVPGLSKGPAKISVGAGREGRQEKQPQPLPPSTPLMPKVAHTNPPHPQTRITSPHRPRDFSSVPGQSWTRCTPPTAPLQARPAPLCLESRPQPHPCVRSGQGSSAVSQLPGQQQTLSPGAMQQRDRVRGGRATGIPIQDLLSCPQHGDPGLAGGGTGLLWES